MPWLEEVGHFDKGEILLDGVNIAHDAIRKRLSNEVIADDITLDVITGFSYGVKGETGSLNQMAVIRFRLFQLEIVKISKVYIN